MKGDILVILNGTCGSGKTTAGRNLSERYGYPHIEVDGIIKSIKDDFGITPAYNSLEVYAEVKRQLVAHRCPATIISSIFVDQDLPRFRAFIDDLELRMLHIVMNPSLEVAIDRTQKRTCFRSKTPTSVTEFFFQRIQESFAHPEVDLVIDNSELSEMQTVDIIAKSLGLLEE